MRSFEQDAQQRIRRGTQASAIAGMDALEDIRPSEGEQLDARSLIALLRIS
jgi:hypothetical protein